MQRILELEPLDMVEMDFLGRAKRELGTSLWW